MPTLAAYSLISLLFTVSCAFNLSALLLPNWIYVTLPPVHVHQNFGLFRLCSYSFFNDDCRPFPSQSENDCKEEYFCEEWGLAALTMVLASIIGFLVWLDLIGVLIGGRLKRERSWKRISSMFILHALLQFASIFIIAHLFTMSTKFYYGAKYDLSFIFANVSACFSFILAIILFSNGLFSPPEYAYMR
ncbi:hypothetical protein RclHR1_01030021 [Rhizophagus clarus]|uniref:Uncharacterized protein n=1 Tax=Rhizophagus clarus TaxID=94130 RepID=A0A2Z6QTB5_9GLOM|nr:hypothetical protein RclHR1_01030021 [Rhizophagus clarus]